MQTSFAEYQLVFNKRRKKWSTVGESNIKNRENQREKEKREKEGQESLAES